MIVDLPNTTTTAINHKLVDLRNSGGAVALGRVLSLVLVTDEMLADDAIEVANDASREHPSRVLVLVQGNKRGTSRLDAQIRVGGDAGASEVIVLRMYGPLSDHGSSLLVPLLLPDARSSSGGPGTPRRSRPRTGSGGWPPEGSRRGPGQGPGPGADAAGRRDRPR